MSDAPERESYDGKLVRGARVSSLGTLAKALHPLFLLLATRLFGPTAVGVYIVATAFIEVSASLLVGGFKDGVVMFGGRGDKEKDAAHRSSIYQVLANAVVMAALGSVVLVGVALLAGSSLVDFYFSHSSASAETGQQVAAALPILLWALPCIAIIDISVAATKSLMIMTYDAIIVGFLKPALLVVFAIAIFFFEANAVGLSLAYLGAHVVMAVVALWAFARHFSVGELVRAVTRFRFHRALLAFALPQSLNMTLNVFITRIDMLMLAYFGIAPGLIAFYGTAAMIIRNVRQAKLAFSGAFAPVIARLHAQGRLEELEERFAMVARWATMIAFPALFIVLGMRRELLLIFDASYTYDTTFMLLLAVPPFLSCSVGLAGNIVVMTGHSRWNLFNSAVVGVSNAALNVLWIPKYGLIGAALATALASTAVSLLQLWEARRLVGVRWRLSLLYKPLLAGAVGTAVLCAAWFGFGGALLWRVIGVVASTAAFVAVVRGLGVDPRDRDLLRLRRPQ